MKSATLLNRCALMLFQVWYAAGNMFLQEILLQILLLCCL